MFEKDLSFATLLDFYGVLLPERQRDALGFYYDDDLSLSEIADELGISRQGVRDAIKRGETELLRLESAIGASLTQKKLQSITETIARELSELADVSDKATADKIFSVKKRIEEIADL